MYRLNKEQMTTNYQDEKITLVTLFGGIWHLSPLMAKIAWKTTATLRDFMDWPDDFVNVGDTFWALTTPRYMGASVPKWDACINCITGG